MIGKTTLPQMWWPLMGRPSVTLPYCPVCGRSYCHGLAHEGRLHFRWTEFKGIDDSLGHMPSPWEGGHWEYLLLDEGCDYLTALGMDGWRRLR